MYTMSSSRKRRPITEWSHNRYPVLLLLFWLLSYTGVVIFSSGCAGAQNPGRSARGTLRFRGEPQEASLSIDETRLGPISMFEQKGVLLLPGEHRIVVQSPGYFPEYRLVTVEANDTQVVEFTLRRIPE